MTWDNGPALISRFELHLQGSYQTDWQEILDTTGPDNNCNINFFEEQVQNMFSNIFTKDEWSKIAKCICTHCRKPRSMTIKQLYAHF
jgi:L-asparaginase/Glu-tRNA(Gln) amidotransferase subunit D